ncbi:hypothetical protein [Tautonia sociabilis]|uniref:DUF1156 domain-containing protein n=1 Tax=Tautonia sociabilis TaxID=2080755 RepID=A0A432MF57_9BACT|nr:hypothetical protein [Tautonia sociabilis]RUL84577.1 hypothetical protein TsocGM_20085 [Tautonia sociabilis]
MAVIERVEWSALDRQVETQQRNRETFSPVVSLFRWWARRPHAVAGSLLDAAIEAFGDDSFVVSDPFSGGGTVAFEAARRGLKVYAQDLYPWPSLGLATCLNRADLHEFHSAKADLIERLDPLRKMYRRCGMASSAEITHVIRVRTAPCLHCRSNMYIFRDPLISVASRRAGEAWAFYGCSACGAASRRHRAVETFSCGSCQTRWRAHGPKVYSQNPQVQCPHCRRDCLLAELLAAEPRWHPVLVLERNVLGGRNTHQLRAVERGDPVADRPPDRFIKKLLCSPIPEGLETGHLLRGGFRRWSDLYTKRQIHVIRTALEEVNRLDVSEPVKTRLRLSVLGACEMPGYLCRWERHHPKAFEAIANHHYSRSTVVVETNLLSPTGRGTIPRRLEAAERGLQWMGADGLPSTVKHAYAGGRRRRLSVGAIVVTGSSERQILKDGVARLVLTDPPYHDDLQYGELARLFHAWMVDAFGIPLPSESREAVPNSRRGTDVIDYERLVAACLAESRRVLAPDGRLILTYHNKDMKAWRALGNAIRTAGFRIVGLATVSAENSADHCKRGKEAFLCDLVIECIPRRRGRPREPRFAICGNLDSPERRNLIAVGRALAERVNQRQAVDMTERYASYLRILGEDRLLIR